MNIGWGKTHPTQQDDSHDTISHNYSEFSAANINNKPGPGYPDPYNNGSSYVKAVKYVSAGGEKITITELANGIRIEQAAGGTPYRVYTPPNLADPMAGSGLAVSGAQDPTHGGPIATAPSSSSTTASSTNSSLPNNPSSGAHDVGTGGSAPSTTPTASAPTPLPHVISSGAQDSTHGNPVVTVPVSTSSSSTPADDNAGSGLSTSGAQDDSHMAGTVIAPTPTTATSAPTTGPALPNTVSSGAHDVGGGTTPVYTATPSPSNPPTPPPSMTMGAQDPTHGGPIAATPAPTVASVTSSLPNVVTSGAHDVGTGVTMPAAAPGGSASQTASGYNPGMQFTPAYGGDPAHPH